MIRSFYLDLGLINFYGLFSQIFMPRVVKWRGKIDVGLNLFAIFCVLLVFFNFFLSDTLTKCVT
jgi:hypothetical protein